MKYFLKTFYFIIGIVSLISLHAQCPKLVWADEFSGVDLNTSNWNYQLGDGCDINVCQWGNSELEWYTSSKENVTVSDGTLKLIARRQTIQNRAYTSGRIRTNKKVDIKFGRIEARMKMPVGQGIWPAFWMLPTDEVYGGWPTSGELDIMEYLGHEPSKIHGTVHYGNPWPNNASSTSEYTVQNSGLNADFHDYALEWTDQSIKWFIDGYLYASKSRTVVGALKWPFDQKFYFLFNLAVGGVWPGNPNTSTAFPQTFEIDYIRVYDLVDLPYISGQDKVLPGEKNIAYKISNMNTGSTVEWTVPSGAKIIKGQNTDAINVDWGNAIGNVHAKIISACGESNYNIAVSILPVLSRDIVLENYDLDARIKKTSSTGILTEDVPNPLPNSINDSKLSGKYVRSNSTQYDVLFYDIADIKTGADFLSGDKKLYIDIYSTAPVGTQVLLQLEDKSSATSSNYPTGRHSRYAANTTKQNEWERLALDFLDRPSTAVSDFAINQMVLLFAPNSFTGATYYLDNFDIYSKITVPINSQSISDLVTIFPNPVSNELNIQYSGKDIIDHVNIFDSVGRWVNTIHGSNSRIIKMKTNNLSSGIYNIAIAFKNGVTINKKIRKQ